MGWQGNLMFLDMKEVYETILENKEEWKRAYKQFVRHPTYNLLDLEHLAYAFERVKGVKISNPGGHCSFAVHIYKGERTFYFFALPYFCFMKKMGLYHYLRKMLPDSKFFHKMWRSGDSIYVDERYLFEFEINNMKYQICNLLLTYPDWLEFKKGLGEVIERKEEFIEFIQNDPATTRKSVSDYFNEERKELYLYCIHWRYLENLYEIIRDGNEIENKQRILCLVSGEAPTPEVPLLANDGEFQPVVIPIVHPHSELILKWYKCGIDVAGNIAMSQNGERIYFVYKDGRNNTENKLIALNQNGNKLWEKSVPEGNAIVACTDDGNKIIATNAIYRDDRAVSSFASFDRDGNELWRRELPDFALDLVISPTGESILLKIGLGNYSALMLLDDKGNEKDFMRLSRSINGISYDPKLRIIAAFDLKNNLCIKDNSGTIIAKHTDVDINYGLGISYDAKMFYKGSKRGILEGYDLITGELLKSWKIPQWKGSVVVATLNEEKKGYIEICDECLSPSDLNHKHLFGRFSLPKEKIVWKKNVEISTCSFLSGPQIVIDKIGIASYSDNHAEFWDSEGKGLTKFYSPMDSAIPSLNTKGNLATLHTSIPDYKIYGFLLVNR